MTNKNNFLKIGIIATLFISIFSNCAIQPNAWTPPTKPAFEGKLALNEKLTNASQIDLLGYYGAEEFVVDKNDNIYCGVHKGKKDFSSGAILKIKPDDTVEEFLVTDWKYLKKKILY